MISKNSMLSNSQKYALVILFNQRLSPRQELMLRLLKKQGWFVKVIAWNRTDKILSRSPKHVPADEWQWVNLSSLTGSFMIVFKLFSLYSQIVNILSKEPENRLTIMTHLAILPIATLCKGKTIYDAAEMFAIDWCFYFPKLIQSLASRIFLFFEGVLSYFVDGILTVDSRGEWYKRHFEQWNRHVQAINNFPAVSDYPNTEEIGAFQSNYSGRKTVAFVGGLMREKGLLVAIDAAAEVKRHYPEVLFLFIGPMKDDLEQVEGLIRERHIGNQVRIASSMPYRKMMAHLVHAEIGLSLYQRALHYSLLSIGNGRKFFTYMQAGLAIVGPRFGEVGKAVELADCGMLVDTEDAGAVAGAILDLLDSPDKLQRCRQNARRAFETQYNWEMEEPKFLRFVEKIVD